MGCEPSLLDKQMIQKPTQIYFHSKWPHTIMKINDNLNMDSTTVESGGYRPLSNHKQGMY